MVAYKLPPSLSPFYRLSDCGHVASKWGNRDLDPKKSVEEPQLCCLLKLHGALLPLSPAPPNLCFDVFVEEEDSSCRMW